MHLEVLMVFVLGHSTPHFHAIVGDKLVEITSQHVDGYIRVVFEPSLDLWPREQM